MRFVTMAGRARHLGTSIVCKQWWEEYLGALRNSTHQSTSEELSSEVGSDEECICPLRGCDENIPMDLDQELGDPIGYESYDVDGTECPITEDAEFTSSPPGIDLRSAELINAAGPSVSVEDYPGAAQVISESKNLYTQIWESDKLYESRKIGGPYYPFSGLMEWEVVEWLHSLDVPMEKIDRFFELEYVSSMDA